MRGHLVSSTSSSKFQTVVQRVCGLYYFHRPNLLELATALPLNTCYGVVGQMSLGSRFGFCVQPDEISAILGEPVEKINELIALAKEKVTCNCGILHLTECLAFIEGVESQRKSLEGLCREIGIELVSQGLVHISRLVKTEKLPGSLPSSLFEWQGQQRLLIGMGRILEWDDEMLKNLYEDPSYALRDIFNDHFEKRNGLPCIVQLPTPYDRRS